MTAKEAVHVLTTGSFAMSTLPMSALLSLQECIETELVRRLADAERDARIAAAKHNSLVAAVEGK